MTKSNRVMAHERAGNHFLMESINLNFKTSGWHKPHKVYESTMNFDQFDIVIHIVRNGMDNLSAMYHWLRQQKANKKDFAGLSFSEYLRGIPNSTKLMGLDPVVYWAKFVDSYYGKIYTIRYEDLHRYPIKMLEDIERHFNLERKTESISPLNKLVGQSPRKGIIGDYKTHFTEDDKIYFWSKAEEVMNKYGYYHKKNNDLEIGDFDYENL